MNEQFKEFKNTVIRYTPGTEIDAKDFYVIYKLWCQVNAYDHDTVPRFNNALRDMGYRVSSGKRTRLVVYSASPRIGKESK